jgi:hypothetical protein
VTTRVLPAITLWQPWASLIALGLKPYETRDWRPPHHLLGQRVAIHAAKRKSVADEISPEIEQAMMTATGTVRWFELLPYGAVVCTAFLESAHPASTVPADPFGDYTPGRWAWHLVDVRPLRPPVPAKGDRRYGWPWEVPDSVNLDPPAVAPRRASDLFDAG